jgi:transcriptional regulator with XRE-family HTH domain
VTLAARLREYRERLGWSQNQLHRVSEVPQSTISDIESGKTTAVTYETMAKLAKALEVSVSELGDGGQTADLQALSVQGMSGVSPAPNRRLD